MKRLLAVMLTLFLLFVMVLSFTANAQELQQTNEPTQSGEGEQTTELNQANVEISAVFYDEKNQEVNFNKRILEGSYRMEMLVIDGQTGEPVQEESILKDAVLECTIVNTTKNEKTITLTPKVGSEFFVEEGSIKVSTVGKIADLEVSKDDYNTKVKARYEVSAAFYNEDNEEVNASKGLEKGTYRVELFLLDKETNEKVENATVLDGVQFLCTVVNVIDETTKETFEIASGETVTLEVGTAEVTLNATFNEGKVLSKAMKVDVKQKTFVRVTMVLLENFLVTLKLFGATLLFALPLGLLISFGSMSKFKPLSYLVKIFVWIIRGTPLMLQLVTFYFGPGLLVATMEQAGMDNFLLDFFRVLNNADPLVTAIIAFAINYACYFSEIYRGGIESIPQGQYEAGYVLGMTKSQTFFRVVLLQVVKRIVPPMSNEIITLVKDTSLARIITVYEIIWAAQDFTRNEGILWPLFYTAVFYLIFSGLLTLLFGYIEKKLSYFKA